VPSYGLIVEGLYDRQVYENLTRKVDSPDARFFTLDCGGVGTLMTRFPALLKALEWIDNGGPVDKALVIRDSGNRACLDVENDMRAKIAGRTYRFPQGVEFCAVRQETETWLLADEDAITRAAGTGRIAGRINGELEDIVDPKGKLKEVLSRLKVDYLPQVLGTIANNADLTRLRYRLPSFRSFETKV